MARPLRHRLPLLLLALACTRTSPPVDTPASGRAHPGGPADTAFAEQVRTIMEEAAARTQPCFEQDLVAAPTPTPDREVTATLAITPDGSVRQVTLAATPPPSPTLELCLDNVLGGRRFPPPPGKAEVRLEFPLRFAPEAP